MRRFFFSSFGILVHLISWKLFLCRCARRFGVRVRTDDVTPFHFRGNSYSQQEAKCISSIMKDISRSAKEGNSTAMFLIGGHFMSQFSKNDRHKLRHGARCFLSAAQLGHADAQFNLAVCYARGIGVMKDEKEATGWFRKAADNGDATARFNLAVRINEGCGTPRDQASAIRHFFAAASQGHLGSQYIAGLRCLEGMIPPMDLNSFIDSEEARDQNEDVADARNRAWLFGKSNKSEAARWFRLAAEQGHARAQFRLARLLERGFDGCPANDDEALRFYRAASLARPGSPNHPYPKAQRAYAMRLAYLGRNEEALEFLQCAAENGHSESLYDIGRWYEKGGQGLKQNLTTARRYYVRALRRGHKLAGMAALRCRQTKPLARAQGNEKAAGAEGSDNGISPGVSRSVSRNHSSNRGIKIHEAQEHPPCKKNFKGIEALLDSEPLNFENWIANADSSENEESQCLEAAVWDIRNEDEKKIEKEGMNRLSNMVFPGVLSQERAQSVLKAALIQAELKRLQQQPPGEDILERFRRRHLVHRSSSKHNGTVDIANLNVRDTREMVDRIFAAQKKYDYLDEKVSESDKQFKGRAINGVFPDEEGDSVPSWIRDGKTEAPLSQKDSLESEEDEFNFEGSQQRSRGRPAANNAAAEDRAQKQKNIHTDALDRLIQQRIQFELLCTQERIAAGPGDFFPTNQITVEGGIGDAEGAIPLNGGIVDDDGFNQHQSNQRGIRNQMERQGSLGPVADLKTTPISAERLFGLGIGQLSSLSFQRKVEQLPLKISDSVNVTRQQNQQADSRGSVKRVVASSGFNSRQSGKWQAQVRACGPSKVIKTMPQMFGMAPAKAAGAGKLDMAGLD